MQFSPYVGVYRVNEKITCTAGGYPAPSVSWEPVRSPGASAASSSTGSVLTITDDMVGDNTWRCRAENAIGSTERLHSFTVNGTWQILIQFRRSDKRWSEVWLGFRFGDEPRDSQRSGLDSGLGMKTKYGRRSGLDSGLGIKPKDGQRSGLDSGLGIKPKDGQRSGFDSGFGLTPKDGQRSGLDFKFGDEIQRWSEIWFRFWFWADTHRWVRDLAWISGLAHSSRCDWVDQVNDLLRCFVTPAIPNHPGVTGSTRLRIYYVVL